MKTPAIEVGKAANAARSRFPLTTKTHKLQVGLNWSTWVEGEHTTDNGARLECLAATMQKHNQRTCDRVQAAIQAAMDKERERTCQK